MTRFAQHTTLVATPGNAARLADKFLDVAERQRHNPDCELMVVSRSAEDRDVVVLTEVWSSEAAWEEARRSPATTVWAEDMPALVARVPQSVRLELLGGKGIP